MAMTTEEAISALTDAGAESVNVEMRDGDRASIRVEAGGRKTGISVDLPHGLDKAVSRLKQWIRESI